MTNKLFIEGSLGAYLEALAGRTMVPGGGSAAAVSAALGTGLNLMVIAYSLRQDTSSVVQERLLSLKKEQDESLILLEKYIDEDCIAFRSLMRALSEKRDAQAEYIAAAEVPFNICRECCRSISAGAYLAVNSNRNLITDVGCAAQMLKAAFYSAKLNVEINLKYISSRPVEKTEMINNLVLWKKNIEGSLAEITGRVNAALTMEKKNGKDC
ncbi:MAG: cyclodeaminase/cyclohydrolase family protein [Candidatus Omnitrophota bacterium]